MLSSQKVRSPAHFRRLIPCGFTLVASYGATRLPAAEAIAADPTPAASFLASNHWPALALGIAVGIAAVAYLLRKVLQRRLDRLTVEGRIAAGFGSVLLVLAGVSGVAYQATLLCDID